METACPRRKALFRGTSSRNFAKQYFANCYSPKNMSPTICQIFGRFFHTSMTCTEIFARNFIHVLHSVISNAICAHFTISIHALVFVHNHRQYIFCNFNSLRIYVNWLNKWQGKVLLLHVLRVQALFFWLKWQYFIYEI